MFTFSSLSEMIKFGSMVDSQTNSTIGEFAILFKTQFPNEFKKLVELAAKDIAAKKAQYRMNPNKKLKVTIYLINKEIDIIYFDNANKTAELEAHVYTENNMNRISQAEFEWVD